MLVFGATHQTSISKKNINNCTLIIRWFFFISTLNWTKNLLFTHYLHVFDFTDKKLCAKNSSSPSWDKKNRAKRRKELTCEPKSERERAQK